MNKSEFFSTLLGVLIVVLLCAAPFSVRIVSAGTVGVVTRMGEVTGRVLHPGLSFITPFIESTIAYNTKLIIYETATPEKQKLSDADHKDGLVDTNTSDGQPVDIAYTIRFSVDPSKATWIAQNIGNEEALVREVVKTESRIWARNIPRRYEADFLYTGEGSETVQLEIEDTLRPKFEEKGILLDLVGIREFYWADAYVNAISEKQVEFVKIETAENIATRVEKEKVAKITLAEGEAEAQRLQRETLTQELLEKLWIEKWNGTLPGYVAGDAGNIIQIPGQ